MRIYLLLLLLAVAAHSKFRHLHNLTLTVTAPPLIKALTPTEFAYQCADTIVIVNVSNDKELQRIQQPTQFPV